MDQHHAETPLAKPPGLRILVVEDNADFAWTVAALLRRDGHDVSIAKNASEAIAAAQDAHPEVVILDIGLPGTSGYELARQFRAMASVPIMIAATGFGDEEHRQRSVAAGIDQYLVKPIDMLQLMAQLREHQSAIRSLPDADKPQRPAIEKTLMTVPDAVATDARSTQDSELELKILNYLRLRLPSLNTVAVQTQRGTAILRGTVPSKSIQRRCVDCCCAVAGVLNVIDRLVVSVADN